jgi:hypothetical protein
VSPPAPKCGIIAHCKRPKKVKTVVNMRLILMALAAVLIGAAGYVYWPRAITETALAQQLAGAHCRFAFEAGQCRQRGLEPMRSLFLEAHDCDMWAVECLGQFKSRAAVEAMLSVIAAKTDVQTCDGVRPVRSYAVRYLGDSGDRSAIEPLRRLLASAPTQTLSAGAAGCRAGPEDLDAIRAAIEKLD